MPVMTRTRNSAKQEFSTVGSSDTLIRSSVADEEDHDAFRPRLHLAHRNLCAAAIFLRAAGDIVLLRVVMETTFGPLPFAQRAR